MSQELDPLTSLLKSPSVEFASDEKPKSSNTNPSKELQGLLSSPSAPMPKAGGPGTVAGGYENLSFQYKEPLANYIDYGVPLAPGYDWDEIRARNQGVGEKLGRGLVKMGVTTLGAVAENTVGIIAGLGSMASGGTYADNAVGRVVDRTNEWFRENVPHYYTQAEMSPDISERPVLTSANFWTDKFLNGLGYSLGSIATAYLTGGTGLLSRGVTIGAANLLSKAAIGSKMAVTGQTLKNIYSASKMIQSGTKLTDAAMKYGRAASTLNAAGYLEMGMMMSLGESSVEAREKSGQFREEAYQDWQEQNPGMDMPENVKAGIEESARALENATLVANLALLTPTNLFAFGKMLKKGKMATESLTYDITQEGEKIVQALPKSGFGKAIYRGNQIASPIYKNALNESFQEGAQFFIGDAGIDYFKNKFDTGQADLMESMSKGLSNTFGTADGIESMLLGALTGGGMGVAGTTFGNDKRARNIKQANTDKLVQIYNSGVFKDFVGSAESKQEMLGLINGIEQANAVGNYEVADRLRLNLVASYALKMHNLGALDLAFEQLDDLAMLPEEEFKKAAGFALDKTVKDQTGGKTQSEVVGDIKEEMTKMIKLNDRIDNILQLTEPNPSPIRKMFESKEEKETRQLNKSYNQKVKGLLLNSMIGVEKLDQSIDENFTKLQELSPVLRSLNKDSLLAVVRRNKIQVDEQGNINLPNSLVDVETTTPQDEANKKIDNQYITTLAQAIEESQNLNQLDAMDFKNAFTNFSLGLKLRENAIAAFNELVSSPSKRDLEISKQESNKRKAAVKHATDDANELIKNAKTSVELDELVNINLLSPELIQALKKKQDELIKQEQKLEEEYKDLPIDVLEELMADIESIEDEDPQRAVALSNIYTARKQKKTSEQVEAEGGKTNEELIKEKEAKEALSKLQGTSSEQIPGTINATPYINQIEIKSPDARRLVINGIEYTNNEINSLDAIQYSIASMEWNVATPTTPVSTDAKADIEKTLYGTISGSRPLSEIVGEDAKYYDLGNNIFAVVFENGKIAAIVDKNYEVNGKYIAEKAFGKEGKFNAPNEKNVELIAKANNQDVTVRIQRLNQATEKLNAELDALEVGQQATTQQTTTEGKEEVTISGVKLFNLDDQEVLFDINSHGPIVYEIAEVILTAQSSEGTAESLGKSEVEILIERQLELNALRTVKNTIDKSIEELGDPEKAGTAKIQNVVNDIKLYIDNLQNTKTKIISSYARQGYADFKDDAHIKELNQIIKDVNNTYKKLTTELKKRKNLEDTIDPEVQEVVPLTDQEENDYQHRIGKLRKEIDDLNAEIEGYTSTIELGFGDPTTIQMYEEEREATKGQLSLVVRNLNTLISEYENRKSGQTSGKIPPVQRTPQPVKEQGIGGESEVNSGIPQQEELDVNKIADKIAEEYYNPDTDYEGEFEDEDEDDTGVITTITDTSQTYYGDAEIIEGPNVDSTIADIKIIKPEHEYVDDYSAVIANNNGELLVPVRNMPGKTDSIIQQPIAPWLLTSNTEIPNGSEVEFMLDLKDPNFIKANYPETERWKYAPIYVVATTSKSKKICVGLLSNYKENSVMQGEMRKDLYAGLIVGKKVTSNIVSKEAYNDEIINVKLANGQSYFYNILDYSENPTLAIAIPIKGQPTLEIVSGDDTIDLFGAQVNQSEFGQVAMVVETPNGGKKHIKLHTADMTKAGVTAVIDAVMKDHHNRVTEIVGFNKITEKADILNNGNRDLIFQDFLGQGDDTVILYTFYLPEAESYIRISGDQLVRLFIGDKNAKFSFVEVVRGEKGGSDFKTVERKDQKAFVSGIQKAFIESVAKRKYNIKKESFQITEDYPNPINPEKIHAGGYLEYLTSLESIPDINQNGHTSILSMDKKVNRVGSVYFNVGINFGDIKIDGKTTTVSPTVAKSASNASISPDPIPFTPDSYEVDEDITDDEFEEDDEDTTNDLLGNDVESQEADRLEQQLDKDEDTYTYEEETETPAELRKAEEVGRIKLVTEEDAEITAASLKDEGLSGTIAQTETIVTDDPIVTILDKIQSEFDKEMLKNPITGEDEYYVVNGQKLQRITNISSDPFTGTKEQKEQSSARGQATHTFIEQILLNKPYSKPSNFSALAFLKLVEQANKIKNELAKRGEKVIAVEQKVYDTKYSFAGTFDILVKTKKGEYKVIDIKTGTPSGLTYYNKPYTDPKTKQTTKSKRQSHGTQLSLYAYALNGRGRDAGLKNLNIENGDVFYIPMISDDKGKVTDIQDFKRISFTLNRNIEKLLSGSVTFEEQTKSADPTVKANTTNSKKAATTTAKKGTIKTKPKAGEWMKGSVEDAGIRSAVLEGDIDAAGVVNIKKAMGKTITEEEAQEIINNILKKNC